MLCDSKLGERETRGRIDLLGRGELVADRQTKGRDTKGQF